MTRSPVDRFDPEAIRHWPEPLRRHLGYALEPGTALNTSLTLSMHGDIRIGRWLRFTARQSLTPDRFRWAARARLGPLTISGYDQYRDGSGAMCWHLLGRIPVLRAGGPDVTRSARGRLVAEAAVLLPAAYDRMAWTPSGPDSVVGERSVDGHSETVEVHVAGDGRVERIAMQRWGNPDGRPYGRYPFEVRFRGSYRVGGVRLPRHMVAAWPRDPGRAGSGDFFRAEIDAATLS